MKRLSKNFYSIIAGDLGRRLLGFAAVTYLARKLGVADFGAMNVGFTVLTYAVMASTGGLSTFGTRSVARREEPGIVNRILSLRLVNAVAAYAVVVLAAVLFVRDPLMARLIIVFCLSLFASAFLLDWYFQGKEEMGVIAVGRLASAATYLALILVLAHSPADLLWVAAAAVAGDLIATAILLILYSRRRDIVPYRFDLSGWKLLMSQAVHIGGGSMIAHASVSLPPIVLGILMTNTDVGVYSAASKIVFFLLVVDRVAGMLLLPASSRLHASSPDTLTSTLETTVRYIVLIALPLSVGGTMLAGTILPFVFGSQYAASVDVFRILIWFSFFTLLHTVYATGLIATGQEKLFGKIMMVSGILYSASVILCTMAFGVVGTAAAVVGSEAMTVILVRRAFSRFVQLRLPRSLSGIAAAAIVMGIVLFFVHAQVLIAVGIGAVTYAAALLILRAANLKDVTELARRLSW